MNVAGQRRDEFTPMDEDVAPQPAAVGSPPRKPPTAVGAAEEPPQSGGWHDPRSIGDLIRTLVGELAMPLVHTSFSPETKRALSEAGIRTLADLLRVSDARMTRLGIDEPTRKFVVEWRRAMRLSVR